MTNAERNTLRAYVDAARKAANAATDYYEAAGRTEQAQGITSLAHQAYNAAQGAVKGTVGTPSPHRTPDRTDKQYSAALGFMRQAATYLSPFEMMNELVGNGVTYDDITYWIDVARAEDREMDVYEEGDEEPHLPRLILEAQEREESLAERLGEVIAREEALMARLSDVLRVLKNKTTDQARAIKLQAEIDNLAEDRWDGPVTELDPQGAEDRWLAKAADEIAGMPTCEVCGLDVPGPHPPAGTPASDTPHYMG